ncbi:pyrimidine-nucleoside phosphorylase [Ligilactobacillus apodemi]|uniref:Pyrimidine-nucleoside phosphorylase n=1 Tax=Ligilactobacillus apodemi DSM 16634 = JCM 16172 TaxID=1423724 RepID=A0A0R1TTG3_9LACO|nr:pyrimidine-nucleoside phosphorylase [Ligilactobacillus apodemi]KRL84582.1 pyrimidine-nucleoside phosphorylase [Ligilactobacillus apodemi DSM 16634 = JCM 16172]
MRMVDIIERKRNGLELSAKELHEFITGYTKGEIPDYQASAFLMATYFNGMTEQEQANFTLEMLNSGDRVDLSEIPGIKVDKHSTGGMGDKTSIPLAPMIAALGIPISMISGRGLGHTGGILDKLEAIPGFKVELSEDQFIQQVKEIGVAIISTTGNIAPADKKLYALRDVTATVDSIPLIAGSIMSKKIASGTDALVLDVKTGSGAFMKEPKKAKELAQAMVAIGQNVGLRCMAVISDMDQPLGNTIGNSLEIEESIEILKGNGLRDITDLVLTLGSEMVVLARKATTLEEAREMLIETIVSQKALEKFGKMITSQGGDKRVLDNYSLLPQARYQIEIKAKSSGHVAQIKANELGIASMLLGGGRQNKEDQINYGVGLRLHKKVGDKVETGESLVTVYSDQLDITEVEQIILASIEIGAKKSPHPLIHEIIN